MSPAAFWVLVYCIGAWSLTEMVIVGEHKRPGFLLRSPEMKRYPQASLLIGSLVIAAAWWMILPYSVLRAFWRK